MHDFGNTRLKKHIMFKLHDFDNNKIKRWFGETSYVRERIKDGDNCH